MANSSIPLRIGVLLDEPLSSQCSLDQICKWRGIAFEAAAMVCQALSLNCLFEWFDSYEYGTLDESGNWTGLVRALMDGRYDTSLPVFTPSYERFQVLDFSTAYFYSDTILVTRMPGSESAVIDWSMVNSFDWKVWILFVVCLTATSALLAYLHKLRRGTFLVPDDDYWRKWQPGPDRIALVVNMMVHFILDSTYNGATFSNKMRSTGKVPFTDVPTLIECIERQECTLIAPATSYGALNWLREQGDKNQAKPGRLTEALKSNPMLIEGADDEGVAPKILRRTDRYLTSIMPRPVFLTQSDYNRNCSFYMVPVPFMDVNAFPFPRQVPNSVMGQINSMGFLLQENGLAQGLERKYRLHTDICTTADNFGGPPDPVMRMASMYAVIIVYGIGITTAICAFTCEILLVVTRVSVQSYARE